MARTRDVVIIVIIVFGFLIAFAFAAFMFIGMAGSGSEFNLGRFGGDVGVVEVFGVIDETSARKAIDQIDEFVDGSVKAIVIHINSPGGGVAPSQELYDAIVRAREEKPVVASMSSVAASGGYYIACAADRIVANPGTITGSIGVIMRFHTAEGLLDKIGIGTETVKSGELKDVGSYSRSMTEREESMLRSVVMDSYEQFIEAVALGRGKEPEEIRPLADGSIYTGHQALNHGLVDSLGGLHEAVLLAADLASVSGEPSIVRPYEHRQVTIFDLLGSFLGDVSEQVQSPLRGPQLMYIYQ
ncbi:MAG TPA: signal peptide peptidase SppA [candidate division Zixibacteria bacterium]|nr:signal peptide peptidase SppA [candidate division Zixibacteria bacterium]